MEAPKPQPQGESEWVPPGPAPIEYSGFSTLNTNSARPGIKPEEMWWSDGFMPVGPNFLRTLPGIGDPIYYAGQAFGPAQAPVAPLFPVYTQMWVAGSSCESMSWALDATGNVAPTINIQGSNTELTGPQGDNESFTYAVDVDTSGNQYALTYWALTPSGIQYAVCVFSPGTTGNVAPLRRFVLNDMNDLNSELVFAGLCVDRSGNVYVGYTDAVKSACYIYKYPATSSGTVSGILFATLAYANRGITSLFYDIARKWIWVSIGAEFTGTPSVIAYDINGTIQTTISAAVFGSPTQVCVDYAGNIWVADSLYNFTQGAFMMFDSPIATTPTKTLTVTDNSFNRDALGIGIDNNGIIYVTIGNTGSVSGIGIIRTYAANSNGDVTGAQLTNIEGAATYLSNMISGAVTYPVQIRLSA